MRCHPQIPFYFSKLAQMRKSEIKEAFLIKKEYWNVIQRWKVEQKADLLECIFTYQTTGDYHTESERVDDMMITLIEFRNKNNERYDEICEQNKQIALERRAKKKEKVRKDTNVYERIRTDTNCTDIDKDIDRDRDIDKEEDKESNKKEKINKKKFLEFVLLTEEEHSKLIEKFWQKHTDELIDKLNNYIWSTWKRYKSHYYTILNRSKNEPATTTQSQAELMKERERQRIREEAQAILSPKQNENGKSIQTEWYNRRTNFKSS